MAKSEYLLRQERRIEEHRKELARLEAKFKAETPHNFTEEIADSLHDLFCSGNHTDYCSWFYETWAKPGSTRRAYLEKACMLGPRDDWLEILDTLKKIKRR